MMVGLVACGGVAQAQFTGIGHTAPDATLHIIPVLPAHEVLRVEGVIAYNSALPADVAAYDDILRYDATTGLIRFQPLAELLDETGEWIENAGGTAIIPRRYQTAMTVNNALVNIGATATTVGGTLGVTGASTFTGAATFNGAVQYAGGADNLDIDGLTTNTSIGTHELVLIQDAAGQVRNITVANLLDENGQWIVDGSGHLVPRVAAYNGDIAFTGSIMDVNVPTEIAGTLDVVGNTDVTGTFDVSGAADLASTLDIGTVNVATTIASTDEVLFQQAGATRVESITVEDLLANSFYRRSECRHHCQRYRLRRYKCRCNRCPWSCRNVHRNWCR